MGHGQLEHDQALAVRKVIRGRQVIDCGAGDLTLALKLAELGAREVIAIDKEPMPECPDPRVRPNRRQFSAWLDSRKDPVEVAFVSWPTNYSMAMYDRGLQAIVDSKTVIYLGKNTDESACGSRRLFTHFLGRELLVYLPHRRNVLCIYGGPLGYTRRGEYEERAVFDEQNVWPYEQDASASAASG